jgi:hypothetical protein
MDRKIYKLIKQRNQKVEMVEIGQEFVIHPFDNLQGGNGEWPKTRC